MKPREIAAWFLAAASLVGCVTLYLRRESIEGVRVREVESKAAAAAAAASQQLQRLAAESDAAIEEARTAAALCSTALRDARTDAATSRLNLAAATERLMAFETEKTAESARKAQEAQDRAIAAAKKRAAELWMERDALIRKFQMESVLGTVEMGSHNVVRVEVDRKFYQMNFADKEKLAAVIYAKYFDGTGESGAVRLMDIKTHKDVGAFSPLGLQLE